MTQTRKHTALLAVLAATLTAAAQTTADHTPPLRGETMVVQEPRLSADADGTTRVQLDDPAVPLTQSLGNLSGRVANLHINTGGAGSYGDLFTLRGLANTPYFSDPSVTLYFDDIPLGSSFTYPTTLFGFGSATIYRGPQATAFGRGGEAGVLVFESTEPSATAGGELRGSIGNFHARSAALTARTGKNETADATVSASFNERDGYITNTQLNARVDDYESAAASARVRYRPTQTSELTLQLLGSRLRNGAQPLVPLGGPLFTVDRTAEGRTEIDFGAIAGKAAFDTDLGRLTATTSYTDFTLDPYNNQLVLPPSLNSSVTLKQRGWNEEIRLTSATGSAFAWNAGLWYSDSQTRGGVNRALTGLFPIEISSYELDTEQFAFFGQIDVVARQDWRVTLGLRAEQVKKSFDRSEVVPSPGNYQSDRTFKALLPKLTVSYALSSDTTASASVSAGTKPGGWSAFTGSPSLARFAAEETVAFEAGIDTTLAAKTVKLAARAFYYDIDNYQIERSFTFTDYLVVNAPRARSLGAELEATWRPIPELTVAASLGLTEITLREFTDPFTQINYSGKRAPYAPTYDANLSVTYRHASGWFAGAEAAFAGKTFYDESESAAFAQDARGTLNARIGFDAPRWRVSLFGENLTDEEYYSLIIPGVGHAVPGAPRIYGVEAVIKW